MDREISKLILWYRMGLISDQEFLAEINKVDSIEIKNNNYKEYINA